MYGLQNRKNEKSHLNFRLGSFTALLDEIIILQICLNSAILNKKKSSYQLISKIGSPKIKV